MSREELYAGTITFGSHDPIACSVRSGVSMAVLQEGYELTQPRTFHVLRSALPSGVTINRKTTRFTYEGVELRVLTVLSQPTEPQIRFVADLASAQSRG